MTSTFWTLTRVADALGTGPRGDRALRGVSTDTRTVGEGDVFVALAGETYDGNDFLAQAVARGAAAVVVHDARRGAGLGVPVYVVQDTLHALGLLARFRRRVWGRPVIAVGGSNGKTSTKELVRAALGARLLVHATSGNLNNQIGVPLTLLSLPDDADIAVIEVGTNVPGEVALLRDIAEPTIAIVTTVQEEHLEGFGDLAGVLQEEASLCDGVSVAIVPADEPALIEAVRMRARRVVTAGLGAGDVAATVYGLRADGSGWLELEAAHVDVPLKGDHNLRNAMLALAAARECGLFDDEAGNAIGAMNLAALPGMRSAVTPLGQALLVHDAYNANPGSARAALVLLAKVGAGRQRVAILGTMRELGAASARAHREIAMAALESGADVIAGIGEFARAFADVAPDDPRVVTAKDIDDLWPHLAPRLAHNAAILLKASRGVKLERLEPLLAEWASQPV